VQQRLPRLVQEPIIFAHRGASAHAPENTLQAFQLALRLGSNGIETDVWTTSDGVVVIDHDGYRRSPFGRRWIRSFAHASFPFALSSLDAVLDALSSTSFCLSIDIKDDSAFEPTIGSVRRRGIAHHVYICHPDLSTLTEWSTVKQETHLVHSTRLKVLKEGPEQHAAALARMGIYACNMHHTDWNGGLVTLYHRFGIAAFAWDVQHGSVASNLVRMGIDALYGDDVTVLREAWELS